MAFPSRCSLSRSILFRSVLAGLIALLSARAPAAQGDPCPSVCTPTPSCFPDSVTVEDGPFFEAWVDPVSGNDATGRITKIVVGGVPTTVASAKAFPFKKIQAAIDELSLLTCSQYPAITMPGIVHLMPGMYDPSTQDMPILMRNGVNIQGAGARHCVLRTGETRFNVFYPRGDCNDCGVRDAKRVIVDYSQSITTDSCEPLPNPVEYAEAIDGVTFFGGDVQVYGDNEYVGVHGRISNCVFDMINRPGVEAGPDFGILLVHEWQSAEGPDGDHYVAGMFSVFNNTFVQGWARTSTAKLAAKPGSIGIVDVTAPPIPAPAFCELRYKGRMQVANNLFRSLDSHPRASGLDFIPGEETTVVEPSNLPGLCNEYFTNLYRADPVSDYCVNVVGFDYDSSSAFPYEDPAFVGEMMTSLFGLPASTLGRDWRIMPDSVVIDKGRGPDGCGRISFLSGSTYVEPSKDLGCSYSPIDSFDYDGEGYGNRRVTGAINTPDVFGRFLTDVDIGFDEFDQTLVGDDPEDPADWQKSGMIAAGCANDSLVIPASPAITCYDPWIQSAVPGYGAIGAIFYGTWSGACGGSAPGGSAFLHSGTASCPGSSYTIPPGAILPPLLTGSSYQWFSWPPQTGMQLTTYSYTVPDDPGGACHAFRVGIVPSANLGTFRNLQARFFGSGFAWSNLQTVVD